MKSRRFFSVFVVKLLSTKIIASMVDELICIYLISEIITDWEKL